MKTLNLLIVLVVLLVIGSAWISYTLDAYWIGHATIGLAAFIVLIFVFILGSMTRGRIRRTKRVNTFKAHKKLAVLLGFLVLVGFCYGLFISSWRYEPKMSLPTSFHGWVGLSIISIAAMQLIPSLVIKGRKKIRIPHTILGYTLLSIMLLQVVLGIRIVLIYTML